MHTIGLLNKHTFKFCKDVVVKIGLRRLILSFSARGLTVAMKAAKPAIRSAVKKFLITLIFSNSNYSILLLIGQCVHILAKIHFNSPKINHLFS